MNVQDQIKASKKVASIFAEISPSTEVPSVKKIIIGEDLQTKDPIFWYQGWEMYGEGIRSKLFRFKEAAAWVTQGTAKEFSKILLGLIQWGSKFNDLQKRRVALFIGWDHNTLKVNTLHGNAFTEKDYLQNEVWLVDFENEVKKASEAIGTEISVQGILDYLGVAFEWISDGPVTQTGGLWNEKSTPNEKWVENVGMLSKKGWCIFNPKNMGLLVCRNTTVKDLFGELGFAATEWWIREYYTCGTRKVPGEPQRTAWVKSLLRQRKLLDK